MAKSTDKQPNNRNLNKNGDRRGMFHNSLKNLHSRLKGNKHRNRRLPARLSLMFLAKQELTRVPTIKNDGFDGEGMFPNSRKYSDRGRKQVRQRDNNSLDKQVKNRR